MENNPNKVILHHDGVSRSGDSFDVINQAHADRGFPKSQLGFFVGYHYFIERSGAIRQAREHSEEGAHAIGENHSSIGIGLAGNFDEELPTQAQVDSLGTLLYQMRLEFGINENKIFPHRKYADKTCFGTKLPDEWGGLVLNYYMAKLNAGAANDVCENFKDLLSPLTQ